MCMSTGNAAYNHHFLNEVYFKMCYEKIKIAFISYNNNITYTNYVIVLLFILCIHCTYLLLMLLLALL